MGSARVKRIAATLGPMAAMCYCNVVADLEDALDENRCWLDAGLLSLGFFRILELELNRRLIAPAILSIDESALAKAVSELDEKVKKNWQVVIRGITDVRSGRLNGLELGPLEILLNRLRRLGEACDQQLRATLRTAMNSHLSEEGRQALDRGGFGDLIGLTQRERFRNPAAHTRHVSLHQARDCREHVEEALISLDRWVQTSAR
jgi:hypothetical protein